MVIAVHVALRVPADNDRGPQYMELALAAIHQANHQRLPITLEFRSHQGEATLACRIPDNLAAVVSGQLFAHYPHCQLVPLGEKREPVPDKVWKLEVRLRNEFFPIRRYAQFEDTLNRVNADPLTGLLTAIAQPPGGPPLDCRISIHVRPASRANRRRAERCLRRLAGAFFRRHHWLAHTYARLALSPHVLVRILGWFLGRLERAPHDPAVSITTSTGRQRDREEDLQAAADKIGRLLFHVHVHLHVSGPANEEARALGKLREMAGAFGQFSSARLASFHTHTRRPRPFLLSAEELATLWHPATGTVRAPTMTAAP